MRAYLPDYDIQSPETLDEALTLLSREPGKWRPIAGGTDLMVLLNAGRLSDLNLLDISRLTELRGISENGPSVTFGALTTYSELRQHPAVREHLPNLVESARVTGAQAIQNRGTLGGNIVNASPAADTPPSLMAYGAEIELVSVRGKRRVPYESFHKGYKKMDLAPDELLHSIHVPIPKGSGFHFYRKVGTRQAQAISKTCLAAHARIENGVVEELRIGLGSVAPVPARARSAEAVILGKAVDSLPIEDAVKAIQSDISPIDDIRSTARYRRVVTANVLRQALEELARTGRAS
ncbi:MAG: xanthine dehydrogenase family protein subunit M [Thermoanaerobaculia bacterium]|nr:xanthine dehydrogenase family protein subunit M [Thermoanaerobaculia bacterium]